VVETLEQARDLRQSMRLDTAQHDVDPARAQLMGCLEHRMGLAYARSNAEEDT
jgi:hypothetical protein